MKKFKFKNPLLWLTFLIIIICVYIDLPRFPLNIHFWKINIEKEIGGGDLNFTIFGKKVEKRFDLKQGLDLQGGTELVLETDMLNIDPADRDTALDSVKTVIEKRVNFYGVSEPVIQSSKVGDSYRIIVELPGIDDVSEAIELVGQTAKLEFRESDDTVTDPTSFIAATKSTGLTGSDLKKAQVVFDPETGEPSVSIEFTSEGSQKFEEITTRLVGKPLWIFLDDSPVSFPTVNEPISGGKANISGSFSLEEAKYLAIELNAGALPVPIKGIIEQKNIGATLGQDSVRKSIIAGLIGLFSVMIFMFLYYGKLGLIADCGLIIYGLMTLALYKIIPVTLTMSGIAGFLISMGMAVDSNILIFERMKEEIRWGKPWQIALENGFGRAWDSIRDANICTIITGLILFNPFDFKFLNSSGPIRGFALTLLLGIGVSLFTGIIVTRTLLRTFYRGYSKKKKQPSKLFLDSSLNK